MSQSPMAILVIDDDRGVSGVLRLILSRAGFKVLLAHDADSGWNLARQTLPSLVFCDERLSDADGYDVLRKLKEDAIMARVPVIMMGGTRENGLQNWAEQGAAGFLLKPFEIPELLALVRRVVAEDMSQR
jgi:DNA-binding response OmpR family regulator